MKDEFDELDMLKDELDKMTCRFDELDKLKDEFDELDKQSINWISIFSTIYYLTNSFHSCNEYSFCLVIALWSV